VAGGAVPFLLQGAQAEAAPVTVDAPDRHLPRGNALYAAGPDGQLERTEPDGSVTGLGRYRWVPTGGDPVDLGSQAQAEAGAVTGAGSNTVGMYDEAARTVTLKDLKAGTSTEINVPEGQKYLGTYGTAVLTGVWAAGAERGELHILHADASGTTDTPVAGLDAGAIAGPLQAVISRPRSVTWALLSSCRRSSWSCGGRELRPSPESIPHQVAPKAGKCSPGRSRRRTRRCVTAEVPLS
jgi:hypothetical protein